MHLSVRSAGAFALALVTSLLAATPVPFWGAKESSPVGTDPAKLKPGEFIWDAAAAPEGPLVIVVSLPEQIARVYRNGIQIGVAKVSTGKPGHLTPTGIFTILNKDKDHRSKTYDNAPMPYSERLTWDGIALHAGGVPGFPESHGCVHLPTRFAELLFGITNVGMTVVIANDASAPRRRRSSGLPLAGRSEGNSGERSRGCRREPCLALAARDLDGGPGHARRQRGRPARPRPAQRRRDRPGGHRDRVAGKASRDGGVRAQSRFPALPRRTGHSGRDAVDRHRDSGLGCRGRSADGSEGRRPASPCRRRSRRKC